ncbi:cell division protein ZapA [Microaerobacter geothermalis]|uniref:cell division protein ZapA n=1 Tax=Microaerobacter geothermalis TaxID=674972 RepID=UPI001EFF7780|nr:cell division protein ZapA [Microaerobacter geothermalis]MCF6092515.1 cell division protein ZapA [Microaerobacter geothermalis]
MKKDDKNRVTVEIYGQPYKIVGNAPIDHMKTVARYVDDKMEEIAKINPSLDTAKLAVLSAVNIADEYLRLKKEYEELISHMKKGEWQ